MKMISLGQAPNFVTNPGILDPFLITCYSQVNQGILKETHNLLKI